MRRRCAIVGGLIAAALCLADRSSAQSAETQPTEPPPVAAAPAEAGAPTTAPAAEPPPPPAPPPRDGMFDLRYFGMDLGFEATYDQQRTAFETGQRWRSVWRQTNRAMRLEETVGLEAQGALIDEKLLTFDLGARWGLSQERFWETRPGRDLYQSPDGHLLEYDAKFTLFPRGKISVSGYALREDSRLPRAFLPSLDRSLERYGLSVFLNDPRFPMRFEFAHLYDELTSRTYALQDDEQRGEDKFRYEATWQIDPRHSLRLEYEYEDRSEQYSGSATRFDTTRNYLILNHALRFGEGDRSAWETLARFQDETGDLARDIAEVNSRLRLQHTKSFATNYNFQFLRDAYQELTTDTWRGEAGFTHQLGERLTTSMQLYGLSQSADENADFHEWGGLINLAFARDNDLGRFSANLSYNHTRTDTNDGGRTGVVVAESLTFRDPLPAYLLHTDVVLGSIFVTNAARTRTYLPIRDYIILPLGRYFALKRVPTGNIADRETVLVTYTYRVYQDYDLTRDRLDIRVQQQFKFGLTPYYAGSFQNEALDEGDFYRFRERDVTRHRLGATYKRRRWSVGAEYEYNDDSIDPYRAMHFNGDVVLVQKARQQLDGKATLSRFWFDGARGLPERNTTLLDLGLTYRQLLAQNLEATAGAMYRFEDDSLFGDTHGVDLTTGLEWKIGYFSLLFEAEYDLLDLPGSRDDGFAVWLKLKREIPIYAKNAQ